MDNPKHLENIVIYSVVVVTILALALLSRSIAISLGADNFTSLFVFIGVFILGISLFSMIKLLLYEIVSRIFRDKKELLEENSSNNLHNNQLSEITDKSKDEIEDIRKRDQEKKKKEQKRKIDDAIQYTKEKFASYVSKEDLLKLCANVKLYSSKGSFDAIAPIKVNELSVLDIYHFGWNIWKHFGKIHNQEDVAIFLKKVFAELLKDVEVGTIPKNLTRDESKGIIKIERKGLFQSEKIIINSH